MELKYKLRNSFSDRTGKHKSSSTMDVSSEASTRILSSRTLTAKGYSESMRDSKIRRVRRKKKRADLSTQELYEEHSRVTFEDTEYDEYEEDETIGLKWEPPKPKIPPRASFLVHEYKISNVIELAKK